MRDYDQPPTEEFAMIEKSQIRGDLNGWFTLMKSVMNDYWFDTPWEPHGPWHEPAYVDLFMHKMYFCWLQMGIHIHGKDPRDVKK